MAIANFPSAWMNDEHRALEDAARRFMTERWVPRIAEWRAAGRLGPEVWREAGAQGLLCAAMPEAYGGGGGDFGHDAVILMEAARANLGGFGGGLHSGIVAPYILHYGNEDQKQRWLPKMATGEFITAIAMTEPGTGSDLQAIRTSARRDGEHYVLSGQKTFITNGGNANLIIVACRTGGDGSKGMSLLVVETEQSPGFRRGRLLDKIGLKSQDTSELFFDDVRVPADNLLGGAEGQGFIQLMQQLPQERLIVALGGIGAMERALAETLAYTKERQAFGKPIWSFQNTRFKLAEVQATVLAARAMVDAAMLAHLKGELGVDRAALLKYWVTEQQGKVMDECLQLFGGYGYMSEYPIAELYTDARVQRIYGGTNEIMKELASRFM
ncbi:acyl-CoA dehydrogenase family protein [Piscinibacter sp.]|uniref:acyl-CoA dehydrogenase family protein n=1 Tax=Piscinibacter sp. TaxID=1903157 RepID=UPI001D5D68A5|nr:acyl-CoA dehydrogenase family protein [Piscinibacter sp.]MBK7531884.1 acyl-CoA dehydrogenase family protein [Piscinibacter sp.]MBL0092097.1 acyl-CoA dehydrogenase family protein [Piscinibacter sp.]